MRLCIRYGYSKRELERQIDSMLYERTMLSDTKNKQLIAQNEGLSALRDAYVFECRIYNTSATLAKRYGHMA